MSSPSQSKFEEFLVYPNESIDKLTVNRSFQRMYDYITEKTDGIGSLRVNLADETNYGTAKFSEATGFIHSAPSVGDSAYDDYYKSMLTVEQLKDFSNGLRVDSSVNDYYAKSDAMASVDDNNCWLRFDSGDFSLMNMPNGNKMLITSFDLGLTNLQVLFRSQSVTSEDVTRKAVVNGRTTFIDLTKDDMFSLRDYADEETIFEVPDSETVALGGRVYCYLDDDGTYQEIEGIEEGDDLEPYREDYGTIYAKDGLLPVDALGFADMATVSSLGGNEITLPYIMPTTASMRHNKCNWTSYSSYEQSYIEVTFSVMLDVDKLYKNYSNRSDFTIVHTDSPPTTATMGEPADDKGKSRYFNEKPVVMAQVAFYNNESRTLPCFGYCKTSGGEVVDSIFISTNTLSETPLSVVDALGNELTPLNGLVLLKEFKNVYSPNGDIQTNRLAFDVVLKFMVGSAADPRLVDGIQGISAKAKVQLMMIGV